MCVFFSSSGGVPLDAWADHDEERIEILEDTRSETTGLRTFSDAIDFSGRAVPSAARTDSEEDGRRRDRSRLSATGHRSDYGAVEGSERRDRVDQEPIIVQRVPQGFAQEAGRHLRSRAPR